MADEPIITIKPSDEGDGKQDPSGAGAGASGSAGVFVSYRSTVDKAPDSASLGQDTDDDGPSAAPREADWAVDKYMELSERWQSFKRRIHPEAVWAYYKSLPEWQQGTLLLAAILLIVGVVSVIRTTLELSEPLPPPQVKEAVEAPSQQQLDEVAKKAVSDAQAAIAMGQPPDKYLAEIPDGPEKAKLQADAEKLKAERDKVRYEETYQLGVAALAAGDYPRAVEHFMNITDGGNPYAYKDTQDLLKRVIAMSQSADAELHKDALAELGALNAEQRERKALRVYNLAFMRDSAGISDGAYRARETLVSVVNGWRSSREGLSAVNGALETLDQLRSDIRAYSPPHPLGGAHARFLRAAGQLRADLVSARSALDPLSKRDLRAIIARLDDHNDSAVAAREEFLDKLLAVDTAAREGSVFSSSEIDRNLKQER